MFVSTHQFITRTGQGKSLNQKNPQSKWATFSLLDEILQCSEKYLIVKIQNTLVELIRQNMADESDVLRKYVFSSFKALLHKCQDTACLDILIQPILENQNPQDLNMNIVIFTELLGS